jgi:putative transposase
MQARVLGADNECMTQPRPVYPGDRTMAQKQCYGQEFRLRPDRDVCQVILYVLGYTAAKYKMELHEFVFMSNHDHIVTTDPHGKRPKFIGLLHSLIARAVNSRFGDVDSLWSGRRHSAPRLMREQDVYDKCLYTLLNPVAAGLVRYAWDWEGVTSFGLEYDVPRVVAKPDFFFSDKMPEQVTITLRRPKDVKPELSDRELRADIRAETKSRQGDIVAKFREEKRTVMGMKRVLRQPRRNRPAKRDIRQGIRPNIAAKDESVRVEAIAELKEFWAEYQVAMRGDQAGEEVVYPYGSYRAKLLGRPCALSS